MGFLNDSQPFTLILWTLFLAAILTPVASVLRTWARLRHIPGPTSAGFSKLWLLGAVWGGETNIVLQSVTDDFGSIARIAPNEVVTSDPDLLRHMNGARTKYQRSGWYVAMRSDPSNDNVLSQRDGALHDQLRARMAAGYSGKEVEGLEDRIDSNVLAFVDLIERKYLSTKSEPRLFDMGRKVAYFALDTIFALSLGRPCGFLATDSDVYEYIRTTEENMPVVMLVTVFPWLNWLLQTEFVKKFLPAPGDVIGLGRIMGLAKRVAAERFGPQKKAQNDMLGAFVAHGLTQGEAESEILTQILAGSDTTATAIRHTLLQLISNPQILRSLRAEIAEHKPSSPIKNAEARNMPYLQALIKEGLRFWPPASGLMSKVVPKGGDTFKGTYLPEGTLVGYCAWGVFRDRKIFGDDANTFRPERWLYDEEDAIKEREAALELVFGFGRWGCLGKSMALVELNKIFVELVRRFDIAIGDATKPWKSECAGFFMQKEFWVRAFKLEDD